MGSLFARGVNVLALRLAEEVWSAPVVTREVLASPPLGNIGRRRWFSIRKRLAQVYGER